MRTYLKKKQNQTSDCDNRKAIVISNKTARMSEQNPESSECPLIHIKYFLGKEKIENLYNLDDIKV